MKKISKIFSKKENIILFLIILIGSILRLQGVFTNSFAFTYDVGRDMLALWDIVYNFDIPLIGQTTGLPGVFYGPWWYYILAPFFFLVGGDPRDIAALMSIIGIFTIVLAFLFGRRISGSFLGFVFAGLVSVSPALVSLSSQIWNPNIAPLFVMLTFFVLLKIFAKDKKTRSIYYLFLGLLLAFIFDIEIVFGLLFAISILLSLLIVVRRKISIKSFLCFVMGFIFVFLPRIVFELRHGFLMTKSFVSFFANGGEGQASQGFLNIFINRINIFFNQFIFSLSLENTIIGLLMLAFMIVVFILNFKKMEAMIENFLITSIVILAVFLIGTSFFGHDIWPHYLVGLPVIYVFIFSLSLSLLQKRLSSKSIPVLIFVVIFILNLNPVAVWGSFTKPLWEGDSSVYRNQLSVIDYVYEQAKGKPFKYVVYTPPVHDYTYKYLFLWYGNKKYQYTPATQSNDAYFILEPDLQYPSRLIDWLKERAGDGKIIKDQMLKGGITVETRSVGK